ncbi:MAG: hypothetical protein HN381_12910, partial [Bacteroidetes bacterium]|nr:hypothetical protein [Bacteroidota bacterium]
YRETYENEYRKACKTEQVYDKQGLQHLRLSTYNSFIVERFLIELYRVIGKNPDEKINNILSVNKPINEELQSKLWSYLLDKERNLSWKLFPTRSLIRSGVLKLFDPLNNVDAVSLLTSIRKIRADKSYSPITHQNHPSYRNKICPIETPESAEVGLTMHLVNGVETDVWGNFSPIAGDEDSYLGYAASLVPFFQHNDTVRTMMGAKNLRQAIDITGSVEPMIKTGCEKKVTNLISPIVNKGLLPNRFSIFSPGIPLLVAYMPWYGYNFEDAIVANQDLRLDGNLTWEKLNYFDAYLKPGLKPVLSHFDDLINKPIISGSTVVEVEKDGNIFAFKHTSNISGILQDVKYYSHENPRCGGKIEWTVKESIPFQVGSKLMARYGNKGVVGKFVNPEDMPRLPDDERLPPELRNRPVDLLLNPHGVISRMNLGQLLETQYTLANSLGFKLPPNLGTQFIQHDHHELIKFFDKTPPFNKYGKIPLEFGSGKQTKSPITVGFQYFSVLKQIPSKKAHARRGLSRITPYNTVTGQPVEGKRRNGGQRIGEMELWALAAHQANNIIREILTHRSDPAYKEDENYVCQTTQAIQDHLFMLGFQFDTDGNVEIVSDNDIVGKGEKILNSGTRTTSKYSQFKCQKCDYIPLIKEKLKSTKKLKGRDEIPIDIGSIFSSLGYKIIHSEDKIFTKPPKGKLVKDKVKIQTNKGEIILEVSVQPSMISVIFHIEDEIILSRNRIDKKFKTKDLLKLNVRCPKHTSKDLLAINPKTEVLVEKGGLYDPEIFGSANPMNPSTGWAYIKFEKEFKHPLLNDHKLSCLPILPLKYRFCNDFSFAKDEEENEITSIYCKLIEHSKDWKENKSSINYYIKKLFYNVKDRIFGMKGKSKYGMIRRHGLGRRIDLSARLVLVPDPTLEWDEVSIPSSIASVLFGQFAYEFTSNSEVKSYLKYCHSVLNTCPDETDAIVAITKYFEKNNVRVLVNRAPSLHKYNILSFTPIVHPINDGLVVKLNPIVFKGFGADADGDELSIHALINPESIKEAEELSANNLNNLLSVADGKPVIDFDQDWVLGNFLINKESRKSGLKRFEKNLPPKDTIYRDTILTEMRSSFKEVTEGGVSFSFLELLDMPCDENKIKQTLDEADLEKINSDIEKIVDRRIKETVHNPKLPGYHFSAMAQSGARGTKQTRQILGARGYLSPGQTGFNAKPDDYKIPESLVNGMSIESAYWSTFNARSSMIDKNMGTYTAGYFSRRLILALWPWHIVNGDCGQPPIENCQFLDQRKICSKCYGVDVPENYPAGLIAAQSLSERCTQLSMASFHTGQSASPIQAVESIINNKSLSLSEFIDRLSEISALSELHHWHFQVIWIAIQKMDGSGINSFMNQKDSSFSGISGYRVFKNLEDGLVISKPNKSFNNHPNNQILLSNWGNK